MTPKQRAEQPQRILGTITAPRDAEEEIYAAGFSIENIRSNPYITFGDVCDFTVRGPATALEKIDHRFGDWVWTITTRTL